MIPPPPSEKELRSLVTLLEEDDPQSLDLVCRQILRAGDRILPFLEEARSKSRPELAARAETMVFRLRFKNLRRDFLRLASSSSPDLEEGTWLICRFGHPTANLEPYRRWLDRVAARIQDDLPSEADLTMTFQRLNALLFREMGFAGNSANYYDPDNSYLNRIIETRRGIPLSLSVLYLLVSKRLGIPAYGVGTPGHFLLGLRSGSPPCFLDAFNRGKLLDVWEVRRMLLRNGYELRPEFLEAVSSRDILVRMLRNLIAIYQRRGLAEKAEMLSGLAEMLLTARPPVK